jgi:cytosine deaminase
MADDLLVSNVRPYGAEPTDILIRAGHIAAVGMITPTAGVPVLDGVRKLALPGLVEAHTHLDKSLLGLPWYRNEVGERLIDKIENERAVRKMLPIDPARQSRQHAMLAVSSPSIWLRSRKADFSCAPAR